MHRLLMALVLAWLALTASAATPNLAIATDRVGDVDITVDGRSAKLNLLDYLPAEAEIKLAKGARATLVYLTSSTEWAVTGPGRYRLQAEAPATLEGSPAVKAKIAAAASEGLRRFEPGQRERLTLGSVVMRGAGPLRLVSPDDTDLMAPQPTLIWHNPTRQRVRVLVYTGKPATVIAQTESTGDQWQMPGKLEPGEYSWRIEPAIEATGRSRLARFRVLEAADPRLAGFPSGAQSFSQRLAQALWLEGQDLSHDALLIWRALAAERPDEVALRDWLR